MNVAFVVDSLVQPGGADWHLRSLLKLFPEADIYTSVYNRKRYPELKDKQVITSFLQRFPLRNFLYRHYTPLSPLAFEQFDFSNYDLVISLSAGCAKGVITGTRTKHIGIILTPPRYQWGGIANCRASRTKEVLRLVTPIFDHYLRMWDIEAGKRPDVLVVISRFVQNRVKKVYGRDSTVVYPGIDTEYWRPAGMAGTVGSSDSVGTSGMNRNRKRDDFYLVVSRLYDYKRVDLAIRSCCQSGRNLVVVGEGPDEKYLKSLSCSRVKFVGYEARDQVRTYMQKCRAFLFPGVEDFGLTPVEAMACGTPVIAYNKGGVTETVIDGETGLFFDRQTPECLSEALRKFEYMSFDQQKIIKRGRLFSEERLLNEFRKVLKDETG